MFIRPSVRVEQIGSHKTEFYKIRYKNISWKCVEKIQAWLTFAENIG